MSYPPFLPTSPINPASTSQKSEPLADLYPLLNAILQSLNLAFLSKYSTEDAARIFECTTRTIQEWVQQGKWVARDLPGGKRFLPSDLESFLNKKRTPQTKDGRPKRGSK
jgi:hypothetical protein